MIATKQLRAGTLYYSLHPFKLDDDFPALIRAHNGPLFSKLFSIPIEKCGSSSLVGRSSNLAKSDEAQIITSTVWTEGVHGFTGVPLARILADAGIATGPGSTGEVSATAINDYAISIPLAEIGPDVPLVAYLMDDREMSVRDKGPLWIVYPYDDDRQYQTEVIYSRSIWQLNRLSTAPVP